MRRQMTRQMIGQWHKTPAALQLSAGHIDLCSAKLDRSTAAVGELAATLSQDEMERAQQFVFPEKYREYVVTRGLLRRSLALVSGLAPQSFQFAYTEHKKPYLKAGNIAFNVSHSHGYALVALGLNRNIGVDIERIRPDLECEKLARRFFSKAEYRAVMKRARPERKRAFYAIWTRKEALVKAAGTGIALGLREFEVALEPDEPALTSARRDAAGASSWQLASIAVDEDYQAALATDGGAFALRYWAF